ncbi:MAG: glycosyltransferase family 4 protein [Planctomycetota bacterium]
MRIACYAYIEPSSGSIAAHGHLLVQELLRRGHEIELFSRRSFVYPEDLLEAYPNLGYTEVSGRVTRMFDAGLDGSAAEREGPARILAARFRHAVFSRDVVRAMRRAHAQRPFDRVLYVGTACFGRVAELPTVSWVQGAPGSDVRSLQRHAGLIRESEGTARWIMLRGYGLFRLTAGLPPFRHSDRLIVGSRVSRGVLAERFGIAEDRLSSLPYIIDTDQYRVRQEPPSKDGVLRVLWLGRIVPRKRLDLLLTATAQALAAGCDLDVTVVGGFGFTPGMRRLIAEFPQSARLRYIPGVPREQTGDLLRETDLLVQPSEEEDFGSSVAEAMLCGTPVIVGRTNGTGDYLCPRSLRLQEDSPEELCDAFVEAMRRKRAGELADPAATRASAERWFGVSGVTDAVEAILEQAGQPPNATKPGGVQDAASNHGGVPGLTGA